MSPTTSHTWRRVAMALIWYLIVGSAWLWSANAYKRADAARARLEERQAEEERSRQSDELIHSGFGILERAQTIILVRVIKPDPATLKVLKSWRGPFSAGRVLHVKQPEILAASLVYLEAQSTAWQHLLQAGDDELLIFTSGSQDAIFPGWGWAGAEAQTLMRVLDQAVNVPRANGEQGKLSSEGPAAAIEKYVPGTWNMTMFDASGQPIIYGEYPSKEACEKDIPKMEREQHATGGYCTQNPERRKHGKCVPPK